MGITPAEQQQAYRVHKYAEYAAMPPIPCACGCGKMIPPINKMHKPATYAHGHQPGGELTRFKKGQEAWNKGQPAPWATLTHKGKKVPIESVAKAVKTRRDKGSYKGWNKGIPMRPETRQKLSLIRKGKQTGSANPFYGKKHSPETIARIAAKNSGPLNANWAGGISVPYGPGFTRRFKKLIRERDGNKCQKCGAKRRKGQRALEIHHIDHDKTNNNPTNLITVCASCNVWLSYHRDNSLLAFPKRRMFLE